MKLELSSAKKLQVLSSVLMNNDFFKHSLSNKWGLKAIYRSLDKKLTIRFFFFSRSSWLGYRPLN